jgi:cytochrome c peroxidase
MRPSIRRLLLLVLLLLCLVPRARAEEEEEEGGEEGDPAQVAVGERLFLETRFSQYFFARGAGNANAVLPAGDPVTATVETPGGPIPGPFAGQGINCRNCHFVDDLKQTPGGGNRSYADFARRSTIPAREDGHTTTPRNSPPLVNSGLARSGPFFLHFDGEFPSAPALVEGTLTGRNFGWLPDEHDQAVAHVAAVIRGDDGSGQLAQDFGGSYRRVLAGDRSVPADFRLPPRFRIDVDRASDAQILRIVARLIAAYVESLEFENASPYDRFLEKNNLPDEPRGPEPVESYLQRLKLLLAELEEPDFVTTADGAFQLSDQPFVFDELELQGLRIFLDRRRGNCVACHPPPRFTDFRLHNTGATQDEYDGMHGQGAFARLAIPDLATRNADPDAFLPATTAHPQAAEPFRAVPSASTPQHTDLGLWNLVQNPDFRTPGFQRRLTRMVWRSQGAMASCRHNPPALVEAATALFKTPGLRTLGQSAPYLHTGAKDTLEDVVRFYVTSSALAKRGQLRNGARELRKMQIGEADVAPLAAFLRALNEDYE